MVGRRKGRPTEANACMYCVLDRSFVGWKKRRHCTIDSIRSPVLLEGAYVWSVLGDDELCYMSRCLSTEFGGASESTFSPVLNVLLKVWVESWGCVSVGQSRQRS